MSESEMVTVPRYRGMVNWYSPRKAWGFVRHELAGGETVDLFFHNSEFKPNSMPGANQMIEYSLLLTDKGLRAVDCVLMKSVPRAELQRVEEALTNRQTERVSGSVK